jgi:myo-inositol-1(or 4)-monophosphatase
MLEKLIEIAKVAGKFLKDNEGKISEIKEKGSFTNLVTNVDKGSEALIKKFVAENFPDHGILAEEGGATLPDSDYKWIIDPLDGTTNYTHAYPVYCVSIGVEYKGEVVAGVVYDPNFNEMFSAEKGSGSFMNEKKLSVTATNSLERSLLATGFPYDIKRNPFNSVEHFNEFLMTAQAIRRLGSAALDICYVAAGRMDGFWEVNLQPWDTAAAVLITTEAGGKVTDFVGGKYDIYQKNILLSNGLIHEQMIEVLKRSLSKKSS